MNLLRTFEKESTEIINYLMNYCQKGGIFNIDLERAYKKGFDEYAYYGISKDEVGAKWQHVGIFCFNIGHSAGIPKLNIYKK
jgi:hypothetical protein